MTWRRDLHPGAVALSAAAISKTSSDLEALAFANISFMARTLRFIHKTGSHKKADQIPLRPRDFQN